MIVKCYISGILIKSGDEFKNEPTVIDTHPIFKVSVRSLLARAKRWGLGGYSAQEEKLLFLALLNSTNAVEWEVPATPSEQVVKKNLESMFKLVAWYDKVITEGSMIKLPKLRVTQQ
ncbi:MAG: hypothetical protein KGH96_23565, partial [Sphingomonadales bacterium]|nr:hypothetical protein [Sphingomonadales bacterium]